MNKTAITPTREQNYTEWYQEVVKAADLAENSPVRGCMVIKPLGYAIWENMQNVLDTAFKATGHVNAYFPLLIPLSFMAAEAEHVEGFAKECAVVTHHRLRVGSDGKLGPDPQSELEEPFVIRPTSETMIGHMYAKWVKSYRDLPLLMNQWCNVMRWEMRTRLFLRTAEFLWQEGHTAHASQQEAEEETLRMLEVYRKFAEETLAIPVIPGKKTPDERFPGAVDTYTVEAMMQDGKALQAGTSHFLGQNFAKSAGIKFLSKHGSHEFAWTTSWGVSTRMMGALIMTHSDDDGLVLPPRIAPIHVIINPIYKTDEERTAVLDYVQSLAEDIRALSFFGKTLQVKIDDRDIRGGDKMWQAVKQGIPLRIEIGPRDLANNSLFLGRRDHPPKDKTAVTRPYLMAELVNILTSMQQALFTKAQSFQMEKIKEIQSLQAFEDFFSQENAGFALVSWHENAINHPLLAKLKVTPRCIPLDNRLQAPGTCVFTGEPATQRVIFAKAY